VINCLSPVAIHHPNLWMICEFNVGKESMSVNFICRSHEKKEVTFFKFGGMFGGIKKNRIYDMYIITINYVSNSILLIPKPSSNIIPGSPRNPHLQRVFCCLLSNNVP